MTPAPAAEPAPAHLAPAAAPERPGRPERSVHTALRAERAQLTHWRRLLRARLDLAVAGLAPPERLGALTSDLLADAVGDLPTPDELRSAVTVPSAEDTVDLMNRIRVLDRGLRRYGEHIDAALEDSTVALIHDLAAARPVAATAAPPTAATTAAAPA